MTTGQLVKAQITNLDTNESVVCMFNPEEYEFSKNNSWTIKHSARSTVGLPQWCGGSPASLSLTLYFDTLEAHEFGAKKNSAGDDVRNYTKGLWDLMTIADGKETPPKCSFQWGRVWSFVAVVTSLRQQFTLFKPDGTPVRAKVTISFQQLQDQGQYPKQNPTSGGGPGEHTRVIGESDTLAGMAYEEYGDPTVWRHIAETNRIDDARHLRVGQVLLITPLPDR